MRVVAAKSCFAGFADGGVYTVFSAIGQQTSMSPNIYFKNLNQFLEYKKENRTNLLVPFTKRQLQS
jgi:hypothetical protein